MHQHRLAQSSIRRDTAYGKRSTEGVSVHCQPSDSTKQLHSLVPTPTFQVQVRSEWIRHSEDACRRRGNAGRCNDGRMALLLESSWRQDMERSVPCSHITFRLRYLSLQFKVQSVCTVSALCLHCVCMTALLYAIRLSFMPRGCGVERWRWQGRPANGVIRYRIPRLLLFYPEESRGGPASAIAVGGIVADVGDLRSIARRGEGDRRVDIHVP